MQTARWFLTLLAVLQAIGTLAADLNRTHVTNPLWLGHARFHTLWQTWNTVLYTIIEVLLLWWAGPYVAERFYLAAALTAIPCLGFVVSQAMRSAFGATLSDPNGIPPLPVKVGGKTWRIDGNAAAVYMALVVLAVLLFLFRRGH